MLCNYIIDKYNKNNAVNIRNRFNLDTANAYHDSEQKIGMALHSCRDQVIPGFDSVEYVDEVLSFYEQPNIVTAEDITLMEKYRQDLGSQFCRRCEYCQPCPNGVMITPAMGYPILVKRNVSGGFRRVC